MKLFFSIIIFFTFVSAQSVSTDFLEMPTIFSTNMVLQQKSSVPLWGRALPKQNVDISTSWGAKGKAVVGADSAWKTFISTPKAGGPYTVNLRIGDSTIVYTNVLIGEVWICSGQSNMDMPVEGWPPTDTVSALREANYPMIRLFTVKRTIASTPQFNCTGTWQVCTPATAASFSAAGYFFGRNLFRELKVPIGLIQSTWGGTPVEAWTSEQYVTMHEDYKNFSEQVAKSKRDYEIFISWMESHKILDVEQRRITTNWKSLDLNDSIVTGKNYQDSSWARMDLPTLWEETQVGNFNGVIWFRKQIQIPNEWRNKELIVELGPIDDYDATYVNGINVGGVDTGSGWNVMRKYTLPAGIIQDSILSIAVRVIDLIAGGGLYGPGAEMNVHPTGSEEKISLTGEWKYMPAAEFRDNKLYLFSLTTNELEHRPPLGLEVSFQMPTALYNGMIAPLIPYTIKGAIWYQGEGNTRKPEAYKALFSLMIKNWREDWKINFPFYFVQIAPFQYGDRTPSQFLREAQFQTLSVPGTGMVVTMDIGDSSDIHPKQKQEVGERLARWALAKDYKKKRQYSGPLYKSFKISKNTIIISFDHANGLRLILKNNKHYVQIAGEDSIFKPATVIVKKDKLIVTSAEVLHPIAVRYAWHNIVEGTLFNKYGLPASSFRTDQWSK